MYFKPPKIYPITDTLISALSLAEQVERLIGGGATLIQLREKDASPGDFYRAAEKALKIARRYNVKIIINDRVDIALALKADGVHLGQDDLSPEYARQILGDTAIIGFSTHNLQQAISAINLPIDYLAIGPVFATSTKKNPDAVVGVRGVEKVRAAIGNFPLVAIGGINRANFREVLNAGADSAAIIRDLLENAGEISETLKIMLTD